MKLLISLFLLLTSISSYSQEDPEDFDKVFWSPSASYILPLTSAIPKGTVMEHLIQSEEKGIAIKLIAGDYFFTKNFGVHLGLTFGNFKSDQQIENGFKSYLENEYGDNFFVLNPTVNNLFSGNAGLTKSFFGLNYRYVKNRFVFIQKVSLAQTHFTTYNGNADLKSRGTNNFSKISVTLNEIDSFNTLIITPEIGYKLSKRFLAMIELPYSYYRTDMLLRQELRNTFTNETKVIELPSNPNVHTIGIGISIRYLLDS